MEYNTDRAGIYRLQHRGHSFSWTGGDSHAYTLGHALGINVGSKEAFTVGVDMSFKLAAVLDVSFGWKYEIVYTRKWKNRNLVKSTSIKEDKVTKEYNLTATDKTETINKNTLYIGYNAVEDKVKKARLVRGTAKEKTIKKPSGQFSTNNTNVMSNIYIDGSEEKYIGGYEEKNVTGNIIYTSTQGYIQLEAKTDITQTAGNTLTMKADILQIKSNFASFESEGNINLHAKNIFLKANGRTHFF